MKRVSEEKSCCSFQAVVAVFLVFFVLMSVAPLLLTVSRATAANDYSEKKLPALDLRVDEKNRARAFCRGVQAIVSIAGFFEFYELVPGSGRKRVFEGPWKGNLREEFPGTWSLKGSDPTTGAVYTLVFKQVDPNTVELFMTFKAPSTPSNLGFDIAKLSGDFFKGAALEARPAQLNDAKAIPVQPLPVAGRMLATNKNRILVKSALCDLEIEDLTKDKTMLMADFRQVPWDRSKSIFIGGVKSNLSPGSYYSFRYAIRCLPPSTSATRLNRPAVLASPSEAVNKINSWSFYSPLPKENVSSKGHYQIRSQDVICGIPSGSAEIMLAREIKKLTSLKLAVTEKNPASADRGIFIERVPQTKASGPSSEGFEIVTSPEKVVIKGASERACLYGAYALLGMLRQDAGAWRIGCGTIRDWPDLPIRGVCIEMLTPAIRDVSLMKRYLEAFSMARSNVVIFLHTPRQMRSWQRNTDDGGWTKEQMTEVARYARSLHMDVWAGMSSRFTRADFPQMDVREGTKFYNPFSGSSYDQVFSLHEELRETYRPSTLLISRDEMQGLSIYATESGKSTAEIFATDVRRIHDWLARQNIRTAIWGDMLLDHWQWDAEVGSANSNNRHFNSGATHLALKEIPKDVLILDWHYTEKNSYRSVEYFRRNGFRVVGSPWHDPKAAQSLARSVKKYDGQGVITTDWGFFSTLSPSATTLYAPLCAWSSKCSIDHDNGDVTALAETMRNEDRRAQTQTPVSLAVPANGSTSGLFGIGSFLDLSALTPGRRTFGDVVFDVLPDNGGVANNCVIVSGGKDGIAGEKFIFKGEMRAESVAFLHTGLVEEPRYRPRKLGRYVVEYENGHKEAIDLLENWNITDIRSSEGIRRNDWSFVRKPDELIGAKPAWRGVSASGIPLNVQSFIWKNPYPGEKIRSIRMGAATAPPNTMIALLGLTFLR